MAQIWALRQSVPRLASVQLGEKNFTDSLAALGGNHFCLVEFYASWCPACQHFAPTFEKLAAFLKSKQLGDSTLYVARVDCASEVKLCGEFNVSGYPSLLLGLAPDFGSKALKQLRSFEGQRELPLLASWVGAYFNTTLTYVEQEAEQAAASASASSAPRRPLPFGPEWLLADVEGATLQLWSIMASTPPLHAGAAKRAALREVLATWAEAHPSASCKTASARLLSSFESLWPPDAASAPSALLRSSPCGPAGGLAWRGAWLTCAGSRPETRGYSCGLWLMIHTMALSYDSSAMYPPPYTFPVRAHGMLPERTAAPAMLSFLNAFNSHFFACEPCVRHFSKILAAPEAAALSDRRQLALWLWRVHNEVNERLRGIETRYGHSTSGDPAYPKEIWPPPERCPDCRRGTEQPSGRVRWDEDAVWALLQRTYGRGSAPGADGAAAVAGVAGVVAAARSGGVDPASRVALPGSFGTSKLTALLPALGLLAAAALLYIFMRIRSGGAGAPWRRRGGYGFGHSAHGHITPGPLGGGGPGPGLVLALGAK
ncbi:hypothetical protein GPECTOR_113g296 [Gonium pectorale]|uniref:Sulfhydryl oxidase n=1 Tax=Gonium pectorale TaxID=33097 RepID=A0A150FZ52_GONPE|nr:hypothetical protein GPECTOR_113g296 [Gonium pectorale]|eukprot:KXZ42884.1 hypothetical protein GPECTOR_113g296 [Gonium pectorale]